MGFFLRSTDGGATYERIEMPLVEEERNVHLLAVDPTDADRVLLRMTRRSIDPRPERVLLTEDGGDTWETVALGRQISGAAFSDDGTRAWVTSRIIDGLFGSDDGARTFTQRQSLSLPCVSARGDEVWICVDELVEGYALGRSMNGGTSVDPMMSFANVYDLVPCADCSAVGHVCPEWFPDLVFDLRLDGGTGSTDFLDGSLTGNPRDAGVRPECSLDGSTGMDAGPEPEEPGGCGCRATGSQRDGAAVVVLALLWLGYRRRRRSG